MKSIDDAIKETPADRLNAVILKYFKTQYEVAELLEMSEGTFSSYVNGRYNMTKKFALRLETSAGINAEYIINNKFPMMKDDTRQPIHKGRVPKTSLTDTKTQHGITKQFILQYEGDEQILKPNGEASVVNLVLGDFGNNTNAFQVINSLGEFEENYGIALNSTIILKNDFKDKNLVLFYDGDEYKIGLYNKEIVVDIKSKKEFDSKDIEIKGRIICECRNIRYNKKTGRIF